MFESKSDKVFCLSLIAISLIVLLFIFISLATHRVESVKFIDSKGQFIAEERGRYHYYAKIKEEGTEKMFSHILEPSCKRKAILSTNDLNYRTEYRSFFWFIKYEKDIILHSDVCLKEKQ